MKIIKKKHLTIVGYGKYNLSEQQKQIVKKKDGNKLGLRKQLLMLKKLKVEREPMFGGNMHNSSDAGIFQLF